MNRLSFGGWLLAGLLLVSCSTTPTQEEIENDLEARLSSAVGPWQGSSLGDQFLLLKFTLQARGDSLAGNGWQWFGDPVDSTEVTVHGTYRQPVLNLGFEGIAWSGETGSAVFRGEYRTVGGILDTLRITTPARSGSISLLLNEL